MPPALRPVLIIFIPFLVFFLVFFVDGLIPRVLFTGMFIMFFGIGVFMLRRNSEKWPQSITLDMKGLSFDRLQVDHGVDKIPWSQVEDLDLFHTAVEGMGSVGSFMRINLRQGPFRLKVVRPKKLGNAFQWDINIPLSTDRTPSEVVEITTSYWIKHRG